METTGYTTLSRQSGLMREMQMVANNIANAATSGYRQEGLIFSEFVKVSSVGPSLSMSEARIRNTSMEPGAMTKTNGTFDLAIEGDGFFLVETPRGDRLTRAGQFSPNAEGELVTNAGHRVLDNGGAALFVPPDARDIAIAPDGTLSVGGAPLGQLGLYLPGSPNDLMREDGVLFRVEGDIIPAPAARMLQGFIEGSNVNAVGQLARMVEIQRSYEMGQSFLKAEDDRIRQAIKALIR